MILKKERILKMCDFYEAAKTEIRQHLRPLLKKNRCFRIRC